MALNADLLKVLMLAQMLPSIGPDADKIWGAYARGVVTGLKLGTGKGAVSSESTNGAISPGGYKIDDRLMSKFIQIELLAIGQILTPRQIEVADAIGASTKQIMNLARTPISGYTGFGADHGGPLAMLPIVAANFLGIMPGPEGSSAPLQLPFFLAISQIATHTLTALEVKMAGSKILRIS